MYWESALSSCVQVDWVDRFSGMIAALRLGSDTWAETDRVNLEILLGASGFATLFSLLPYVVRMGILRFDHIVLCVADCLCISGTPIGTSLRSAISYPRMDRDDNRRAPREIPGGMKDENCLFCVVQKG